VALAIDGDLYDFRQLPSFSNIYPSQDDIVVLIDRKAETAGGQTHDWLEGRHLVLLFR
jgi:hypothetical protein